MVGKPRKYRIPVNRIHKNLIKAARPTSQKKYGGLC